MSSVNSRLWLVGGAVVGALVLAVGAGAGERRTLWQPTSDMITARSSATLTPLADGRILAVGGYTNGTYTRHTELYDPQSGSWVAAPDLQNTRGLHSATLANGILIVAGGWGTAAPNQGILDGIERYTLKDAFWSPAGTMMVPRYQHMAVGLLDGKVLFAGGCSKPSCLTVEASAEIYDPATGASWAVGPMTTRRHGATATLLANGKVLVAGGSATSSGGYLATAELFDPSTGTWTPTGSMATARTQHTALRVSGMWRERGVLVAGGLTTPDVLASAEIYNPWTGTWSPTGDMIEARAGHTMTRLISGMVLVTGGVAANGLAYLTSAELYDPTMGRWYPAGDMNTPRTGHAAALLANGRVLVAGGHTAPGTIPASASSELYMPLATLD